MEYFEVWISRFSNDRIVKDRYIMFLTDGVYDWLNEHFGNENWDIERQCR